MSFCRTLIVQPLAQSLRLWLVRARGTVLRQHQWLLQGGEKAMITHSFTHIKKPCTPAKVPVGGN